MPRFQTFSDTTQASHLPTKPEGEPGERRGEFHLAMNVTKRLWAVSGSRWALPLQNSSIASLERGAKTHFLN